MCRAAVWFLAFIAISSGCDSIGWTSDEEATPGEAANQAQTGDHSRAGTSVTYSVPVYSQQVLTFQGSYTPYGCVPTSVAMVLAYWTAKNGPAEPAPATLSPQDVLDLDASYNAQGGTNPIDPSLLALYRSKGYSVSVSNGAASETAACDGLASLLSTTGGPVMAMVGYDWQAQRLDAAGVGHTLVVTGVSGDRRTINLNDPWSASAMSVSCRSFFSAWSKKWPGTTTTRYAIALAPIMRPAVEQMLADHFKELIFPIVCENGLVSYAARQNLGGPQTDELEQVDGDTYQVQYFDSAIVSYNDRTGAITSELKPELNGGTLGDESTLSDPVIRASYRKHWPRMNAYLDAMPGILAGTATFDASTMTPVLSLNQGYPHYVVGESYQLGWAQTNVVALTTSDGQRWEVQVFQKGILATSQTGQFTRRAFELLARPGSWFPTKPYCR